MKQIILMLTLMSCLSFNYAQNIINEQFVSESDNFSGGRIFNVDNRLFVVMTFNGRGEDSIDGYKHQFIIKQYDFLKNKFELVFNSKNEYYHSYLSDIIVFQNHFIIKTSSQSENVKSKILAIDLNGKIKSEKPVSSFGGLLSNINGEKYFLFVDETKNEYLFDLKLNEQVKNKNIRYINKVFIEDVQFYLNSAGVNTTYSYPRNSMINDIDSVLFKNNIGGCFSGNVIKLEKDTKTKYLLGCQFDPNFENDVINLFQKTDINLKKVSTFSLGSKGHHWVYDAILFNGKIFAIFSSGDADKKKKLGFNNIDQFMWFVVIDIH